MTNWSVANVLPPFQGRFASVPLRTSLRTAALPLGRKIGDGRHQAVRLVGRADAPWAVPGTRTSRFASGAHSYCAVLGPTDGLVLAGHQEDRAVQTPRARDRGREEDDEAI